MMNNIKNTVMGLLIAAFSTSGFSWANNSSSDEEQERVFRDLKNYKIDSATMYSAGLPKPIHFEAFKNKGVRTVVDLIPGDRSDEKSLVLALGLDYYNIGVEWHAPSIENFEAYVKAMQIAQSNGGGVLTHCKLNWRGAVFTYLYRTTQLHEADNIAKKHMLETWKPNSTWQAFIDKVQAKYSESAPL